MAHPSLLAIILTIRTQEVVLHCPVRGTRGSRHRSVSRSVPYAGFGVYPSGDFLECHDEDDFMADDTSLGNEDGALYVLSGSEPSGRCMVWIMLLVGRPNWRLLQAGLPSQRATRRLLTMVPTDPALERSVLAEMQRLGCPVTCCIWGISNSTTHSPTATAAAPRGVVAWLARDGTSPFGHSRSRHHLR